MRRILLFLFLNLLTWGSYAQTYTQLWMNVDSLMNIKNYKESGDVILRVRKKAISENNIPEKLRTILAEHHTLTINKDNNQAFNIINKHFQKHLAEANGIERNLIANFYAQYLLSNINLDKVNSDNFQSLPIENRIQIIDSLLNISLNDKEKLIKEPLSKWQTLLTNNDQIIITPTIYHLLAMNYLDFLRFDNQKDNNSKALENEIQQVNKK